MQIKAPKVRVIDAQGKQLGVLSLSEALKEAQKEGLDLVEVAANASPPVARLVDYKKHIFAKKRQEPKSKGRFKSSETKELRFGPNIGPKDLSDRTSRAREFLSGGDKVKVTVFFKGRQITHPEIGLEKINKVIHTLKDVSKIEQETKRDGRFLYTILKPK